MIETGSSSEIKPVILIAAAELQRLLMSEALKAEGFQIELASNGTEAVERCVELRPDAVLLDVVMPSMDGYAVCAAIRERGFGDQLPIVLVTCQDDLEAVARAYDAGATDFIGKPLNLKLLRHRIRYVYRAGRALRQLSESEARLTEAQRIAQLGSWEWIRGDRKVRCSPEVLRIFALEEQQEADLPLAELFRSMYEEDRTNLEKTLTDLTPANPVLAADIRLKIKGGDDRIVAVHARLNCEVAGESDRLKGIFQDVTEQRLAESRLYHLDHYDALTSLPNRLLFQDRLGQALQRAKREGIHVAAFSLDIHRFKDINDIYGHAAGDGVLRQIAERLQNEVRGADTVARLAGDEFAIAQVGIGQPEGAERLAHRLLAVLSQPFDIEGQALFVDGCIGVAIGPHDAVEPEQLLIKADMALHRAKADGPGLCCFFEGGMDVAFKNRKAIEQDLRQAISENWFELHYQPQIDVNREIIIGVEALLRLRHPENGLIMPDSFIGIAEETGLIVPIGAWVLKTACCQMMAWQRSGLSPVRVAVNLSPVQFREANFTDTVTTVLAESGLDPTLLEVEITENILIRDTATVIDALQKLKALGVQIAMDDFGTGYSSLRYLQRFPFNRIKIDRSFIKEMTYSSDSAAIVGAVIALSKRLRMSTTAEGVETREQLDELRREGCDEAQGYYIGRPMPAPDLIAHIGQTLSLDRSAACVVHS